MDRTELAALNNAEWCDAVCAAHGVAGVVTRDVWLQKEPGPPYYSNAVTLSRDGTTAQIEAVEALAAARPEGFSVKDSFSTLDLSGRGFSILFEAEWLWLDPSTPLPSADEAWERVASDEALIAWEAAWAESSPRENRVFPPALLADERIAFLGVRRGDRFVAGAIANRSTGDVCGFSNFFAPGEATAHFRKDAVAAVRAFATGRPLVGYDRGEEREGLMALGFEPIGGLRVWLREASES